MSRIIEIFKLKDGISNSLFKYYIVFRFNDEFSSRVYNIFINPNGFINVGEFEGSMKNNYREKCYRFEEFDDIDYILLAEKICIDTIKLFREKCHSRNLSNITIMSRFEKIFLEEFEKEGEMNYES